MNKAGDVTGMDGAGDVTGMDEVGSTTEKNIKRRSELTFCEQWHGPSPCMITLMEYAIPVNKSLQAICVLFTLGCATMVRLDIAHALPLVVADM